MSSSAAGSSPPTTGILPEAAPRGFSTWLLPSLAVLFFLSGGAALIYQLLWLRMLGFVFGVTVHAASTVLASFMCGLAIGSYAAGRLADRLERPLVWFGAAEALIGIFALATPGALAILQQGYVALYPSLPDAPAAATAIRFAMSFAVLIVPTALMGATLPLVLKSSMTRHEAVGRNAGVLYAANTTGAIGGTLAAGLYLIPVLGMHRTFLLAAAANFAVGLAAVVLGQRWRLRPGVGAIAQSGASAPRSDRAGDAVGDEPDDAGSVRVRRTVLIVFAVSGFASLALEVIWFRVNVLVLRPTVYAFAVMLATVLGGIALGSALVAPMLTRRRNWLMVLIVLEMFVAAAALLSFHGLQAAPQAIAWAEPYLRPVMPAYLIPLVVISLLTVLPVMLLMGAAFPIGLQLWVGRSRRTHDVTARRVGVFYALNVGGAIAGAIVAGFVMIPAFGSRVSLILLALTIFGSALLLIAVLDARGSRRAALAGAAAAVLGILAARVPDPLDVFLAQRFPHEAIVWREEGVQTTVSIHQDGADRPRRSMYLDGLHQASSAGTMVHVHRRIGHLAMALHPEPRNALVVGLGGGATAGAVSQYPFAQVEVVELSASVVRAAELFSDLNYRLLSRPNVRIRVADGRNHLMLSSRRYDVITADLIQPIHAGAGNVYSAEYFRLVRDALQPGGLAAQWVFGTDAEYRLIMRTFLSVFPHATLWAEGSLMIGRLEPLTLRRADFDWKLQVPETRAALADIGIRSFEDLLQLYTAGDRAMRQFTGPGPLITDDRPVVEYFLSLERRELDMTGLTGDVTEIVRDR